MIQTFIEDWFPIGRRTRSLPLSHIFVLVLSKKKRKKKTRTHIHMVQMARMDTTQEQFFFHLYMVQDVYTPYQEYTRNVSPAVRSTDRVESILIKSASQLDAICRPTCMSSVSSVLYAMPCVLIARILSEPVWWQRRRPGRHMRQRDKWRDSLIVCWNAPHIRIQKIDCS